MAIYPVLVNSKLLEVTLYRVGLITPYGQTVGIATVPANAAKSVS